MDERAQQFSPNNLLNTALKFVFMNSIIKNKTLSHIYIYLGTMTIILSTLVHVVPALLRTAPSLRYP